jgi:hypothetical protein
VGGMTELFEPKEPPTTSYTPAFERCWRAHPVGVKKTAWKAGIKNEWSSQNWDWLANYLEKRHKEDVKWIEGTYVPHLSSIINGERWTDPYQKVKRDRYERANDEATREMAPQERAAAEAAARKAFAALKAVR